MTGLRQSATFSVDNRFCRFDQKFDQGANDGGLCRCTGNVFYGRVPDETTTLPRSTSVRFASEADVLYVVAPSRQT